MTARVILAALGLSPLLACSPSYSPNTYASSAVQQASKVEQGVIVGVRRVDVQASGATGAVAGAAAGGIAGSQAPGTGVSTALTTLGGSLVGGLVGTGIERAAGDTTAYEYIVRKSNGDLLSVTQKDQVSLAIGEKVLLIAGTQARIVPDYTVPAEAAKPQPPTDPAPTAPPAVPAPVTQEPLPAPPSTAAPPPAAPPTATPLDL